MDLMSLYEKCEQDKELFLFSSDNIQKIFGVLFLNSDEKIFKTKIRYNEDIYHIELKKEENRILAFVDKEKVLEIRDGNVVFIKQKSKIVYYFLYPFLKEFNYENEKIIRDGFVVDENAQPLDLERKIVLKYLPKCIISEGAEKHIDTVNKMLFELRLNNKLSEEELNFILSSSSYYYFNIIKLSVLLFDTENFLKNLKQIKFLIEKGNRYLLNETIKKKMDVYLNDLHKFYKLANIVYELRDNEKSLHKHLREIYLNIAEDKEIPEAKILKWKLCEN